MWLTSASLRPFTFLLLAITLPFASLRTNLQIMAFGLLEAATRDGMNLMYNVVTMYHLKRRCRLPMPISHSATIGKTSLQFKLETVSP